MNLDGTNDDDTFDYSGMPPLQETAPQIDDQDDEDDEDDKDDPLLEPTPPNTPARVETTTNEVRNEGTDSNANDTNISHEETITDQQ